MCAGYKNNNQATKTRCTCTNSLPEINIPRDIKNVIDFTPIHEFMSEDYEDDITDAYEYIERIMRYNNPINS